MDVEQPNIEAELKEFEDRIKDAEEKYGDSEIKDVMLDKADFLKKHGRNEDAKKTYLQAYEKSKGVSNRIEIYIILLQMFFKENNLEEIKKYIFKCKGLLKEGGDWEGKNKLKVYEGLYRLITRDFVTAAELLIDSLSTFSSPELITYNKLTFYAVLSGLMTLTRAEIKEKLVNNSEVVSIIRENASLSQFLESYYKCNYNQFFLSFIKIIAEIEKDPKIAMHKKFIVKELRVMIYSQFLESYKSVTLDNMAQQFGVSPMFLDKELSEFISSRRLNCKIDKVSGLIMSQRVDQRNALYKTALRKGELVLNRIQKLSRMVDV